MSSRQSEWLKCYQMEYAGQQVDYSTELTPDDRKTY
jgi:hypothetical protein